MTDIRPSLEDGSADLATPLAACANERGAALIIVLIMLLLLTILGSTLLSSSTTDLQIAGNYRNNQKAFYVSDYAYEYLKSEESSASVYDLLPYANTANTLTRSLPPDPVTGTVDSVNYTVTNVGCQAGAPPGSGGDSDSANAYNVYTIEISGSGPNNAVVSTIVGNLYQRNKPCD